LKTKITALDEQLQKVTAIPEVRSEPVIPIRRDKAIAALTDTELSVLEMLSTEGPKTAPEIKEKVHLSREHTARLMKKLYEEGYLERETGKIPFKYSIKKEMGKLLKKSEPEQA
jgi:DNA-binding MarR family transcriptional regulator